MTPDEYRAKHKKCNTCEHCKIVYHITTTLGFCFVRNEVVKTNEAEECEVYKPIPFKNVNLSES